MTPKKPELMPDEAWLIRSPYYEWRDDKTQADYVSEVNCNSAGASVSYTRTDLYTTACADRDELRAIADELARVSKWSKEVVYGMLTLIHATRPKDEENLQKFRDGVEAISAALTAYEKHKAGE